MLPNKSVKESKFDPETETEYKISEKEIYKTFLKESRINSSDRGG